LLGGVAAAVSLSLLAGSALSHSAGAAPSTAAAEPGGTLRIVVPAEPRSLNQAVDNNASSMGISKLVSERLVNVDADTSEALPGLIQSWDRVDDVTWTMHLAEGVTFSNGEPFDADAAVFSILNVRDEPGAYSNYVQTIADAVATDPSTVTVTTTEPLGFVPTLMAVIPAIPPAAYAATTAEDFGRAPIGTGPFVLDEWTAGVSMHLSRNEGYWGEAPLLDGVDLTWNSEAETRVALLETGEADLVKGVPPQLIDRVDGDGSSVLGVDSIGVIVLQPNSKAAPFDDVRVREAAAHAIDRQALVDVVFSGVGATAHDTIFPSSYPSAVSPEGAPTYDPERSRELLAEVGDIGPIDLYWPNGRYLLDNQVGEALAGMLEDGGFTVERHPMEVGAYFELLLSDEMPGMHMVSIASAFPHESNPLTSFFLPDSVVTYCAQDDLVDDAAAALGLEGEARTEAYIEIARQLVVDDVCPIPLYVERQNWAVSDAVSGFAPRGDEEIDLSGVSLAG